MPKIEAEGKSEIYGDVSRIGSVPLKNLLTLNWRNKSRLTEALSSDLSSGGFKFWLETEDEELYL